MAQSTSALLNEVIRTAVTTTGGSVSDRELLQRFAESGDQAAFAALFRRHSGMVLGVCRRALSNLQDAEDACQATFFVLARRAKSKRWQPSVANWLYTVARHVAGNARQASQRRSLREKKAAVAEAIEPVYRMTGREFLDALDAELDNLPPAYREPLVLCYLEGLTRDEAAIRLAIPAGTLKTRLERGRKRLAAALTKRGCSFGAGLLALATTAPSEASSPRLCEGVLAGATGAPSAAVAKLAAGLTAKVFGRVLLLGVVSLLGIVILALGLLRGRLSADDEPTDVNTPPQVVAVAYDATDALKTTAASDKEITLRGKVLGVDGNPFAGAKLFLVGKADQPLDLGKSGADGRFIVAVPNALNAGYLCASADGAGLDFQELNPGAVASGIELRLVKDHEIHGRLLDTQGKAVQGASARVRDLFVYEHDSLDAFLSGWKKRYWLSFLERGGEFFTGRKNISGTSIHATTTDAEGRFTIRGIGAERIMTLRFSGAGIATAEYRVVNRSGFDPKPYNDATVAGLPETTKTLPYLYGFQLHGPDESIVVEAEKPIRGTVTAADTGKPRPGVDVWLVRGGEGPRISHLIPMKATTDAAGRFEIHGARKATGYLLKAESDCEAGYRAKVVRLADSAGLEPISADIRVGKGVIVKGRMLNRATGKGVPGQILLDVLSQNPFIKDFPDVAEGASIDKTLTADDGTFRLVTIPGPIILSASPDSSRLAEGPEARYKYKPRVSDPDYPQYFPARRARTYLSCRGLTVFSGAWCTVLDTKPGAGVVQQDILLEPANSVTLLLRDPDGKPLTGVHVAGISSFSRQSEGTIICKTDACQVYDLAPDKMRVVVFFDPERRLSGAAFLQGDEQKPVEVRMKPTGTAIGRLVDEEGKPIAGALVRIIFPGGAMPEPLAEEIETTRSGSDGRFKIGTILPDLPFTFTFLDQGKQWALAKPLNAGPVETGKTKDFGDIVVKPVGRKK
jgi:RNA polymerase sigma factor (sigma-70 family)